MSENNEQTNNELTNNEQTNSEQPKNEQATRVLPTLQELNDVTELTRMKKKRHYAALRWYAVYVHPGHEMQIHDFLLGIDDKMKKRRRGKAKKEDLFVEVDPQKVLMECFVPLKRLHVKYSDRMVWKEKVQTPGIIFVHTALDDRDYLFHSRISEYVVGFLNDRTRHWPQPIPDIQMMEFKALCDADWLLSVEKPNYAIGDKVLVLEGPLRGHVARLCEIRETVSRSEVEKDRQGNQILDSEGNPIYKRKTQLCVEFNSELVARFEVDADKVIKAPADAPDYGVYD